jgi:cardiolipin synthase
LINKATESIHLQTYIYDDDETGRQVADALIAAAKRNVSVYLLTDGYASQVMAKKFIHELKVSGVHFSFFEPLFRSKYFYFGRRLHQKVFVADTKFALVGGINITNRYNDMLVNPPGLILHSIPKGKPPGIFVYFAGKPGKISQPGWELLLAR